MANREECLKKFPSYLIGQDIKKTFADLFPKLNNKTTLNLFFGIIAILGLSKPTSASTAGTECTQDQLKSKTLVKFSEASPNSIVKIVNNTFTFANPPNAVPHSSGWLNDSNRDGIFDMEEETVSGFNLACIRSLGLRQDSLFKAIGIKNKNNSSTKGHAVTVFHGHR